jgi:hypothetical protein
MFNFNLLALVVGFRMLCSTSRILHCGDPVGIGRNIPAIRVRVVEKTSLTDRSYVSTASSNTNMGLGWS